MTCLAYHEAIAQASMLVTMELELEAPPMAPSACARERDVTDSVPSPQAEGTGLDDGMLQLAIAARALRRVWRRLRPSDLDYFDLSDMIRSARSLARWLEDKHRVTTSRKWKAWVSKSVQDGGRKILQWVKRPEVHGRAAIGARYTHYSARAHPEGVGRHLVS